MEHIVMEAGFHRSAPLAVAVLLICAVYLSACARKVEGATYSGNGGVVRVEFQSAGKAYVSTGPVSTPCSYTEGGGTVTLVCEGDKTVFTVDDDGALNGPQGGFLGRLTKLK
jgi:hypothetical protein